jgi:ectoine hydroxylase-related dioxygenase (phytanoyl-CoA dioxygenase family)
VTIGIHPLPPERPLADSDGGTVDDASAIERAVRDILTTGYTVLDRPLGTDALARLTDAFGALFERVLAEGDPRRARATGLNRYNVWLPLAEPFLDPEVIADPLVLAVLAELLDGDVTCTYYASDTAMPGSEYQAIHTDESPLFPRLPVALPPASIVMDIPLVDFRVDNGPLEIWPQGTHLIADSRVRPAESALADAEARNSPNQRYAEAMTARQVVLPAGARLLRDTRVWHRGTPNRSAEKRSMVALVYSRSWHVSHTLPIDRSVYARLDEPLRRLLRNAFIRESH